MMNVLRKCGLTDAHPPRRSLGDQAWQVVLAMPNR